jgi:signal peptidase I
VPEGQTPAATSPPATPAPETPPTRSRLPAPLAKIVEFFWPPTTPHVHQTEWFREIVETIVFVVVLVLLLKSFAAEAFVIPTGSMAETLWGYQKLVKCPQCGYFFPVNCSQEVETGDDDFKVVGCVCPNCRFKIMFDRENLTPVPTSGDRVLVAKSLWESGLQQPNRYDVTVFKYPGDRSFPRTGPEKNLQAMNYIKRMIGLPNETIGIYYGNLYVNKTLDKPDAEDEASNELVRRGQASLFMHFNKFKGKLEAHDKAFGILRKPADKILAVQRLVYDNDFPAKDLAKHPRWAGEKDGEWVPQEGNVFRSVSAGNGSPSWLRYSHLIRKANDPTSVQKELITDFMGYNSGIRKRVSDGGNGNNWVGELILECEVTVEQAQGTFTIELAKGVDRFRAEWDLTSGVCTLRQLTDPDGTIGAKEVTLGDAMPTSLKGKGKYHVRFANVDDRVIVWVNGSLPFGRDGVEYEGPPPHRMGPRDKDLNPVGIAVSGGADVSIRQLKLWRDTYYTQKPASSRDDADYVGAKGEGTPDFANPDTWQKLRHLPATTLYVQPGHYLCLGDNSPHSADSRDWGLVPERLLLGRAMLVYYPFWAPFWPLESPVNRVGPIR